MTIEQARKDGLTTAKTWKQYSNEVADNNGVKRADAWMVFQVLGETEAFDGFVTTVEDMADGIGMY